MTFRNPIIPGFHPDPSMCRVGEDYYLVTSSFEYFPGVPVFHSRDLVNWEQIGHCLTRREQVELADDCYSRGIWAPTIRHHDGRFYVTTTNLSQGGNFIVSTDDPAGEWSNPIWVNQEGIDPSLFFENGKAYYITSGNLLSEIDLESGKIMDGPRCVWEGLGGRFVEGPHIYKRDGWYYLMEAEGGLSAHHEAISRSRDIWGPYESCPHNPILSHVGLAQSPIQNVGHADLCEAHDGSWWMVFLGSRPTMGMIFAAEHLGRETFLAPVEWNADGWPVVNKTGSVDLEMDADLIGWHPFPKVGTRDDFDFQTLELCWNYIRNPIAENDSLTERPGFLRLRGSAKTLSDSGPVTFVGRRQQHVECRASALLDFEPTREGDEAGLTALMCFDYHYDVAVVFKDGTKKVIVRRTMKSMTAVVAEEEIGAGPVVLEIRATAENYALGYCQADGSFRKLAEGETRFLTAVVAQSFTGVYLGMYATGNGAVAQVPADFDWFDYTSNRRGRF